MLCCGIWCRFIIVLEVTRCQNQKIVIFRALVVAKVTVMGLLAVLASACSRNTLSWMTVYAVYDDQGGDMWFNDLSYPELRHIVTLYLAEVLPCLWGLEHSEYVHECGCLQVLGLGEKWEGGDVRNRAGGGQKINLLKKELLRHKDDANKIIMFTDRYACHPILYVSFQLQSVVQLVYCHIVCVFAAMMWFCCQEWIRYWSTFYILKPVWCSLLRDFAGLMRGWHPSTHLSSGGNGIWILEVWYLYLHSRMCLVVYLFLNCGKFVPVHSVFCQRA